MRHTPSFPKLALANAFMHKRCRHDKGFKQATIEGSLTAQTASYPRPMCEAIINSWCPSYTHAHVPAMICQPCIPTEQGINGCPCGRVRREKDFKRTDFADIPYFSPAAFEFENESGGAMCFAVPGGVDGPEKEDDIEPIAPLPKCERLNEIARSLDHLVLHDL